MRWLLSTLGPLRLVPQHKQLIAHTLLGIAILSLILYIVLFFNRAGYGVPELLPSDSLPDGTYGSDENMGSDLYLQGYIYNLNASTRMVEMFWLYMGCGYLAFLGWQVTRFSVPSDCTLPNVSVNFYFDSSAIPNGTYDPRSTHIPHASSDSRGWYWASGADFQTMHAVNWDPHYGYEQLYAYPFDAYELSMSIHATSQSPNHSLSIRPVHIFDATGYFSVHITRQTDTLLPQPDPRTVTYIIRPRVVRLTLTRVPHQKAYVLVLFATSWILAFFVACVTVQSWFSKEGIPDNMLMLPVTIAGSISALRALWPGLPPFGIFLDIYGIIPQTFIVVVALINTVWRRKRQADPPRSEVEALPLNVLHHTDLPPRPQLDHSDNGVAGPAGERAVPSGVVEEASEGAVVQTPLSGHSSVRSDLPDAEGALEDVAFAI